MGWLGKKYRAARHAWHLVPYTMRIWLLFSFACNVTWIAAMAIDNPLKQEYGWSSLFLAAFLGLSCYSFVVTVLRSFFVYQKEARKEEFKRLTGLSSLPTCGDEIAIMHTRVLKTLCDLANAAFDEFERQKKYIDDLTTAARFNKLDPSPQDVEIQLAKFKEASARKKENDETVRETKLRFRQAHTFFRSLGFQFDDKISDFYTGERRELWLKSSTATPDDCAVRTEGSGDFPFVGHIHTSFDTKEITDRT